jgi:hypothetical protein
MCDFWTGDRVWLFIKPQQHPQIASGRPLSSAILILDAQGGLMMQLLLIGALVGVLVALLVVRRRKRAYAKQRWMPDIRRVS